MHSKFVIYPSTENGQGRKWTTVRLICNWFILIADIYFVNTYLCVLCAGHIEGDEHYIWPTTLALIVAKNNTENKFKDKRQTINYRAYLLPYLHLPTFAWITNRNTYARSSTWHIYKQITVFFFFFLHSCTEHRAQSTHCSYNIYNKVWFFYCQYKLYK